MSGMIHHLLFSAYSYSPSRIYATQKLELPALRFIRKIAPYLPSKRENDQPAYLTEFRSESVESAAAGVRIGKTPEQPYIHTAIWRFANSCPRSGAIRVRSRNFVRYAG
jgi:hypothetical protein